MIKKCLTAIVLVSGLWAGSDYLVNLLVISVIPTRSSATPTPLESLMSQYGAVGIPITATLFILVYALSVRRKTFSSGTAYGLVLGFLVGTLAALVSFTAAESTLTDAAIKLLAFICQATLAGMLTAWIVKPPLKREKTRGSMEKVRVIPRNE